MKKILMIAALAAVTTGFAQNTNKTEVETVKKTKVTNDEGVEVTTKTTSTKAETELALGERQSYHNFNTVMEPTKVNTDVDYYNEGTTYRFMPEKSGYYVVNSEERDVKVARLYPTSQKGYYLYTEDGTNSFGYFNEDGDFVVESYDPDNDGVMNYVYKIRMDDDTKKMLKKNDKMKKDKMEK
ncbi:MAG: hypothetical protein R3359_01295 [Marinirhabdus sp.]|nr:hypothetical protein [Marinirhabdus sp.]